MAGRERENCIHSRHKTGREENDGGTRRRWQGAAMVEEEKAVVAAASRRNTPPATPLSQSIFSMIFERPRAHSRVYVYIYMYVLRYKYSYIYTHVRCVPPQRTHANGPIAPFRLGRRWLALLRRGCHRSKSGNGGSTGEGGWMVVGGGKALGCPWVERGGRATVSVVA